MLEGVIRESITKANAKALKKRWLSNRKCLWKGH